MKTINFLRGLILFFVLISFVNALNFTGSDTLKICIIEPNGVRTCLNNSGGNIDVDDKDITLELYEIEKEKNLSSVSDFTLNNIIEMFFVLILIFFVTYFIISLVKGD